MEIDRPQEFSEIVQALSARTKRLERQLRVCTVLWLMTVGVLLTTGFQEKGPATPENLRVRQLTVVDRNGTPRLMLGAPLPDPVMHGKVQKRRSAATGLLLNDANGDERGGLALLDDGTMGATFDANGRERVSLFLLPDGTAGLMVNDTNGTTRAQMLVQHGGTPKIQLLDEHEKLLWEK
jgi:hypothetical protein